MVTIITKEGGEAAPEVINGTIEIPIIPSMEDMGTMVSLGGSEIIRHPMILILGTMIILWSLLIIGLLHFITITMEKTKHIGGMIIIDYH